VKAAKRALCRLRRRGTRAVSAIQAWVRWVATRIQEEPGYAEALVDLVWRIGDLLISHHGARRLLRRLARNLPLCCATSHALAP
jgi:hypothetical protein